MEQQHRLLIEEIIKRLDYLQSSLGAGGTGGTGGGTGGGLATASNQSTIISNQTTQNTLLSQIVTELGNDVELGTGWVQDDDGYLWLEVTIDESTGTKIYEYYDKPNGIVVSPIGDVNPIIDTKVRNLIGEEIIEYNDVTVKALTVPTNANLAEFWILGGDIMYRLGNAPLSDIHIPVKGNSPFELECLDELNAFQFKGKSSSTGNLIVYYFYYSLNNT